MRSSTIRRHASSITKTATMAAVALALAAAGGCGPLPADEAEAVEQGLTSLNSITAVHLPRVTRYLRVDKIKFDNTAECPTVCSEPVSSDGYTIPSMCGQDCRDQYKVVLLSDTPERAAAGYMVGAYINPVPREYHGCGPQAVQNLLNYYGDQLPLSEILPAVDTISFPGSSEIASTPDSIIKGGKTLLDSRGGQQATITRYSNLNDLRSFVIGELLAGSPPLVNIHDGNHWVLVTGYKDDPSGKSYFIVDYANGTGAWTSYADLQFGGVFPLLTGYGGWYPRTVLSTRVTSRSNLLTNGGFDLASTIALPWRTEGPDSKGIDVNLPDRSRTGRGNNAWLRAGSWNWNALNQTLAVEPNTTYALTGWVRGTTNIANGYFGVRNAANQAVQAETKFAGTGQYKLLTVKFNSGANTSLTAFAGYWAQGQDSWFQLDEMNLSKNLYYFVPSAGTIDYSRQ
jgi:hypothetical protein